MRIWRHLDLYLTVLVSLAVALLGVGHVVDAMALAGATLATLGAVAAGTLRVRLQLDRVSAVLAALTARGEPSADRLLVASTSGLDVNLAVATDVRLVGVTLGRTLRNQLTGLRRCLESGGTVRVAIIGDEAVAEAARRGAVPKSPDIFAHRLRPSLDLLRELAAQRTPGRLQVRLLDFVPAFGLLAVDPDGRSGRIQVDLYSHQFGGREPTLALHADRDHDWYRHFLLEFERIWAVGHPMPAEAEAVERR